MKASILSILLLVATVGALRADQTAAAPAAAATPRPAAVAAVPATGVAIRQDLQSEDRTQGLRVRFSRDTDLRGVTQTFLWNTSERMNGLGLKIADEGSSGFVIREPQRYELDIHEITHPLVGRKIKNKVATIPIVIDPSSAVAGQYLYIAFPEPLKLYNGSAYGLHLRPVDVSARNSLYLASTGLGRGAEAYKDGVASLSPGTAYPDTGAYGREQNPRDFDLVFFITSEKAE